MPYRYATAFLALAACTGGTNGQAGPTDVNQEQATNRATAEPEVRIFTFRQAKPVPNQPAPTFHQVAMTGRLLVERGCLVVDSGEKKFALVFREGTATFDAATKALTVEGRSFPIGSTISMGGSGGSAVESMPQGDPKESCGVAETWTVVPGSFQPAT